MLKLFYAVAASSIITISGCAGTVKESPQIQETSDTVLIAAGEAASYKEYLEVQREAAAAIKELAAGNPLAASTAVLAISPASPAGASQPFGNLKHFAINYTTGQPEKAAMPPGTICAIGKPPPAEEVVEEEVAEEVEADKPQPRSVKKKRRIPKSALPKLAPILLPGPVPTE